MPELPDVETFRRYLESTSLYQRIAHVHLEDSEILDNVSRQKLSAALHGQKLTDTYRYGKFLFARVDASVWLVLHFGMTGLLEYFQSNGPLPPHTRLSLDFDNGYCLAYRCQRRLGLVSLTHDPTAFTQAHGLGPDAGAPDLDLAAWRGILAGHRAKIKSLLMNQQHLAGIGNIYADEILFQAQVHPDRRADHLTDQEIRALFDALKKVLNETIAAQADPDRMPDHFLLPHRMKGGFCPRCGAELKHIKAGGRTAYYCPRCQRAPEAGPDALTAERASKQ